VIVENCLIKDNDIGLRYGDEYTEGTSFKYPKNNFTSAYVLLVGNKQPALSKINTKEGYRVEPGSLQVSCSYSNTLFKDNATSQWNNVVTLLSVNFDQEYGRYSIQSANKQAPECKWQQNFGLFEINKETSSIPCICSINNCSDKLKQRLLDISELSIDSGAPLSPKYLRLNLSDGSTLVFKPYGGKPHHQDREYQWNDQGWAEIGNFNQEDSY
jgi:hypothetical protein